MKWNERLRQERKARRWTQTSLAEKIGTNTYTVNRWENGGAFPNPFYRKKLIELFGHFFDEPEVSQALPEIGKHTSEQPLLPSDAEQTYNKHSASLSPLTPEIGAHDDRRPQGQLPLPRKPLFPTLWLIVASSTLIFLIGAGIFYALRPLHSPEPARFVTGHPTSQPSSNFQRILNGFCQAFRSDVVSLIYGPGNKDTDGVMFEVKADEKLKELGLGTYDSLVPFVQNAVKATGQEIAVSPEDVYIFEKKEMIIASQYFETSYSPDTCEGTMLTGRQRQKDQEAFDSYIENNITNNRLRDSEIDKMFIKAAKIDG